MHFRFGLKQYQLAGKLYLYITRFFETELPVRAQPEQGQKWDKAKASNQYELVGAIKLYEFTNSQTFMRRILQMSIFTEFWKNTRLFFLWKMYC